MRQNTKTNNLIRNLLIIGDFIVLNILFYVFLQFERSYLHLQTGPNGNLLALMQNFGLVVGQYFFSTIIHKRIIHSDRVFRQITFLVLTQSVSAYVIMKSFFLFEDLPAPDLIFSVYFALLFYAVMIVLRFIERWIVKHYRRMGKNTRRVTMVGSDESLLGVYHSLMSDPSTGFKILGYYADKAIEGAPEGFRHIGSLADFNRVTTQVDALNPDEADELYCSLSWSQRSEIYRIMKYCDKNVIHFYYVPIFNESFGHALKIETVGDIVTFTNFEVPLSLPTNRLIKRVFDLALSSIICLFLLPLIPIIAFIIKLSSPGAVFFKQARTGMNGKEFICYKFRSMHVNKDADKLQATENDPRKYAFGNFMRKTNIDELPQFFNVLRGDMSIVGPRPHMLHHTEVYGELIDKYMVRHFVKPGVTGWAQVTGFRGETKELWQMEGRVKRDIWYIENWSFWLDLRIMWLTAKSIIIPDENAY